MRPGSLGRMPVALAMTLTSSCTEGLERTSVGRRRLGREGEGGREGGRETIVPVPRPLGLYSSSLCSLCSCRLVG